MKGKYKAAIALALLFILLPLTLLLTLAQWVPTLVGIWLPADTRIAMSDSPRITFRSLHIPDLRYIAGECTLAELRNARLTHPSRWQLHIDTLVINTDCLNKLAKNEEQSSAPRSLAQWQSLLPYSWVTVDRLTVSPWKTWQGKLTLALTPQVQALTYQGERVELNARLQGQKLNVNRMALKLFSDQPPFTLGGEFTLPNDPAGIPVNGHMESTLTLPQQPHILDVDLDWRDNQGQLIVMARSEGEPLLDLPWQMSEERFAISDGRWNWPYQGFPLSGRVGVNIDNWQAGLENARISGRLNVLTQGDAGKGNAVLNFGPGRLSPGNSDMPLQLTGEAKQGDLIFYAVLPGRLSGSLEDPHLALSPGALLRSRGRIIDSLNIDEVRWPLAGVSLTQRGIDGRLQAILRAHENALGDFTLHLDGRAEDFLPDNGLWRWRYWGDGHFTPMHARWDVAGRGEWRDEAITLTELSTGFDQLQYGAMQMSKPRLVLDKPVRWLRNAAKPRFTGALTLDAGKTTFSSGSVLPPSTLHFSVDGTEPTRFQFKGALNAEAIGPVQVNGRWDGERLRGQAWWPQQSLTVFQPLVPPEWKMNLLDGSLYAQVAFSAAADQGFEAGGHGVLKNGSVWTPDNEIHGVDFVLPFRYRDASWQLGTRHPVSLRIGEVVNQVTAKNITADLQGTWPYSEQDPLTLSDVSVDVLGGKVTLQQLRLPQHDAALLRLKHIEASEVISAVNPKQFALSGPVDGALPLWLDNPRWIIKDGWLHNPGPMTLRLDKNTADAIVNDHMAAGAAINWLRYMEISRSWTKIDVDNLGQLTLRAKLSGTSYAEGKSGRVNLNYTHQENLFTLWRSLRFADNLQSWLEQHAALPDPRCKKGTSCEEKR
jgi:hypothetical protein